LPLLSTNLFFSSWGGYALPRYLERFWPNGTVDVAEIDPGVTKAAFAAFELDPQTRVNTISLDARNYVDGLIEKQHRGLATGRYDFIYEDALNDYCVPFQLTTKEFNDTLYELLTEDGIYMVELIDTYDSALFLGSFVSTLEQTFPFVTVISEKNVINYDRNTYVVVAAKHPLDLTDVCSGFEVGRDVWYLNDSEMEQLREKSKGVILTDNYAPVENMLAPVFLRNVEARARKIAERAEKYAAEGNLKRAMQKLELLAKTDPAVSVRAYRVIALIFADTGRTGHAFSVYRAAIERFAGPQHRVDTLSLRYNYAMLLAKAGNDSEAAQQLQSTIDVCRQVLEENPDSVEPHIVLGNYAAEKGDFAGAVEHFQRAVDLRPDNPENYENLVQAFEAWGKRDSAVQAAQDAAEYFYSHSRMQEAEYFRNYAQKIKSQTKP